MRLGSWQRESGWWWHCAQCVYRVSNRRTVAKIQERIVERGERGLLSRFIHAKDDKEKIASWRSDLNRILGIFKVCSVVPVRPLLTVCFQKELGVNTRANRSGVRRNVPDTRMVAPNVRNDVVNTQPIVSDVQRGVINTRAPVSNTSRNLGRRQEETRSNRHSVNATFYPPTTDYSPFPRLAAGQQWKRTWSC